MKKLIGFILCLLAFNAHSQTADAPRALKVLISSMFVPEATRWIRPLKLTEKINPPGQLPGLLPGSSALR